MSPNPVDILGMGERTMALMEDSTKADKPFFVQMSYHVLRYPQNAPSEQLEKYAKLIPEGMAPGQHRVGFPAPSLGGFWDRPIASEPNFEYSAALSGVLQGGREQ